MIGNKGFTVIEAVVALTIFAIVSLALTQIVIVSVQNQLKITLTQSLTTQTARAVDYLTKNVRMAKKDALGICTGTLDSNYGVSEDSHEIRFLAYDAFNNDYKCKKIYLDANAKAIKIQESTDTDASNFGVENSLTPTSVAVDDLKFIVSGDDFNDNYQPRITILLQTNSTGLTDDDPLKIETTVSKRQLDL